LKNFSDLTKFARNFERADSKESSVVHSIAPDNHEEVKDDNLSLILKEIKSLNKVKIIFCCLIILENG